MTRRFLIVLGLMTGAFLGLVGIASADGSLPVDSSGSYLPALPLVTIGLIFLINLVLPAVVDLVTARFASTPLKSLTLLVLQLLTTLVSGFSNARDNGQTFDWNAAITVFIVSLVSGAASVYTGHSLNLFGADGIFAKLLPKGLGVEDPAKVAAAQSIPGQIYQLDNGALPAQGEQLVNPLTNKPASGETVAQVSPPEGS